MARTSSTTSTPSRKRAGSGKRAKSAVKKAAKPKPTKMPAVKPVMTETEQLELRITADLQTPDPFIDAPGDVLEPPALSQSIVSRLGSVLRRRFGL